MSKVLFLYPNINTELRIPLALSILIASVRKAGHEVKLFDATFMVNDFHTDNEAMVSLGTHEQTDLSKLVGEIKKVNIAEELDRVIGDFKPDLIASSLVERNFFTAKDLLLPVKRKFPGIPILIGGIMPTIAPHYLVNEEWVDMICVGEGEMAILDVIENPKWSTPNIWTNWDKNELRSLIDMNEVPEQDWTDFDQRHLLKPFMGKVYRGGAFEFSRGCNKHCTFCVAPKLRELQHNLGRYHRTKDPDRAINEIINKVIKYDLSMIAFGDTDFLSGVPKPTMKKFLMLYRGAVGLPFTIQTGVETLLDEDMLGYLRDAQCCAISVGIESGSEKIRKTVIKKSVPKEAIKKAMTLTRNHGLRVTANYMVGVPFETEEDVYETIRFNREINPPSIAVTYFTPFMGTELYDIAVKEGFYKGFNSEENVYSETPLEMPQLPPNRIHGLLKEFVDDYRTYQKDFSII